MYSNVAAIGLKLVLPFGIFQTWFFFLKSNTGEIYSPLGGGLVGSLGTCAMLVPAPSPTVLAPGINHLHISSSE